MNARTSRFIILPSLFVVLMAYNNCGITRPSVEDSSFASVGFKHTGLETSCASCHEATRPAGFNSVLHGNNADCVACHRAQDVTGVSTEPIELIWGNNQSPFTHSSGLTSCVSCHANNRAAPVNGFVHYNNQDCVSCHANGTSNNTDGLTFDQIQTAFLSAYSYTHPTNLTSCAGCHEKNRATPTHNIPLDCVTCHKPNDTWTTSTTAAQVTNIWSTSLK